MNNRFCHVLLYLVNPDSLSGNSLVFHTPPANNLKIITVVHNEVIERSSVHMKWNLVNHK